MLYFDSMLLIAIAFALFGLIIGSFLNVVILRHGARSINGRSGCMSCGAQLYWYDMIPVFSWIALGGRCRKCKAPISIQYPLVEASTAVLFAAIGASDLPIGIQLLSLIIVALLICIAVYDLRHTIIPDEWAYGFAFVAFLASLWGVITIGETSYLSLIVSGPIVALPLFALWLISRGRWMGLGDAKLALGIGFLLGTSLGLVALFLAFVIGALVSVCILLPLPYIVRVIRTSSLSKGAQHFTMKSEVPFGPFLIASCLIVWFMMIYHIPLPPFLNFFQQ